MEQIIFFGWLFLTLVVEAIDGLSHWLQSWLSLSVLAIVVLIGLYGFNKWSGEFAGRVEIIEKKLGITYTPPVRKTPAWGKLLAWFVFAIYILGKSIQSVGWAFLFGVALASCMLLISAFCAYCFIDETVRDLWRKKKERRESVDRVFTKDTDC